MGRSIQLKEITRQAWENLEKSMDPKIFYIVRLVFSNTFRQLGNSLQEFIVLKISSLLAFFLDVCVFYLTETLTTGDFIFSDDVQKINLMIFRVNEIVFRFSSYCKECESRI